MRRQILIIFFVLMFLKSCPVFSQSIDLDEERLLFQEIDVKELEKMKEPAAEKIFIDKEIKYIAAKDKPWSVDTDEIYHYFLVEHYSNGKILKRSCYTIGEDTVLLTSDDELQDYQFFEYDVNDKLVRELSFDGKNVKQSDTVYEYDNQGRKTNRTCTYPHKKEKRSVIYSYNSLGQQVQGKEYFGGELEKYHLFEYNAVGQMVRAMEFHVKQDGKGADGIWFTADDVVSSTKEFFYDDNGVKIKEKKYISPGLDSLWFTEDDELQYYTDFSYQK